MELEHPHALGQSFVQSNVELKDKILMAIAFLDKKSAYNVIQQIQETLKKPTKVDGKSIDELVKSHHLRSPAKIKKMIKDRSTPKKHTIVRTRHLIAIAPPSILSRSRTVFR